jgi:hypothetical protein
MGNEPPKHSQHAMQALRPGLLEADDHKIRRVLAVVDGVADPAINQALLETLRPRLATLRPVRPLRLTRLLFIPLDPLTVPLRGWRPSEPTVPRPVLAPIAKIVRSGLGDLARIIDGIIAGHKADAAQAITQAGELLWPRAAAILATAPPPADWADTGLPPGAYKPLAASIAAVLRRASQLRCLALDEQQGGLATDSSAVADILANIANEPATACAMIARLILVQSPHALPVLGNIAGAGRSSDEKDLLRAAVDSAVAAVLTHMERDTGFVHEIGHGALAEAGAAVRRVLTLLREIEADKSFADHWPRLNAIRHKLDDVCGTRFARGVREGLVVPLTAAAVPVDGPAQTALESSARELRKLETMARKVGDPAGYDTLLRTATDAVLTAADAGTLTPMRKYRLIEILAGSEAAEALYFKACGGR